MNPTRILIADDHAVVREGLPGIILDHGNDWEICGTAADAEAAIAQAVELQPDIVIMDYKMPGGDGLAAAEQMKARLPNVEVLVFSGDIAPCHVLEIYRSSVCGYMLKSEAAEDLVPALEALRHHHHFRSSAVTRLYEQITQATAGIEHLSAREHEILRLIVDGNSSKEIASQLGISLKTVETHRTNLFRKVHCKSVAELIRLAVRYGLVEL